MSKQAVGLGLLGCGQISEYHLRETAADPSVNWVALCDVRPEAAQARAEQFGVPKVCATLADMLADPAVEAVVVATSPEQHVGPVVQAFAAGRHVLVEKPAGLNVAEVEQMLAAQGDLVGASCSCRFRGGHGAAAATELLASGELGSVRRISARIIMPAPETYDGSSPFFLKRPGWGKQGVLADWSVYDFDYLLGLCGWTLEPEQVLANTWRLPERLRAIAVPDNDVEVQATVLARLTGGVVFDYRRALFAAAEPSNSWLIECEHGTLDLCMLPGTPQVVVRELTGSGVATRTLVETADNWQDIHRIPVADFAAAILDGRPPRTSLRNALSIQRLTDAIYESAAAE